MSLVSQFATTITFWAMLLFLGLCLAGKRWRPLESSLALTVLGGGSLAAAGLYLGLAYAAPRDVVQDIAAAHELLDGRTPYPIPLTGRVQQLLEQETVALFSRIPKLAQLEQREVRSTAEAHWVEAHPPMAVLFTVPFAVAFGVHGASLAISLVSLCCLLVCVHLMLRNLFPQLPATAKWGVLFLTLGSMPVQDVIRNAQSGLVLSLLLVAGWAGLRRFPRLPVRAGCAIGAATMLKLFPGLAGLYLLLRFRKAFVTAGAVCAALFGLILSTCGWKVLQDYSATTSFVVEKYRASYGNISLLGVFSNLSLSLGRPLYYVAAAGLLGYLVWQIRPVTGVTATRESSTTRTLVDLEFSLFVALMPLLSPVSWDHHLSVLLLPVFVLASRLRGGTLREWALFALIVVILSTPSEFFFSLIPQQHGELLFSIGIIPRLLEPSAVLGIFVWLAVLRHRNVREDSRLKAPEISDSSAPAAVSG